MTLETSTPEAAPAGSCELRKTVSRLERRTARERAARQQAEKLLEEKSLELYEANQSLQQLNVRLEEQVSRRTGELREALKAAEDASRRSDHLARHDPLTGLPNRRYLGQKLDELTKQGSVHNETLAILHLDLDRFKQINDTIGHAAGDFLLQYVARELRRLLDGRAFAARIGGDEFVIAMLAHAPEDEAKAHIERVGTAIIASLSQPVRFNDIIIRSGVSIGAAYAAASADIARQLIVNADIALYRAKERGRGRIEFFTSAFEKELRARKQVADELADALQNNELTAFYQPRMSPCGRHIHCVEALVRWRHPERGLIPPFAFLGVAEDIGLSAHIDRHVLETALNDLARWRAQGLDIPKVSVNVSEARLLDPRLLADLDRAEAKPGSVSFELLESIFLDDPEDRALQQIDALKKRGFCVEIDDFGSGRASILSVLRIRPETIKVDRRLVRNITEDLQERQLLKSIIDIGASLGVNVVAEGVETLAQAEICAAFGCDSLQGYAFAKPMPADELAAYARQLAARDAPEQ